MKKKMISLLITTAMCASLTSTSFANFTGDVKVFVNGESLNMLVPPVIQQGRTLVPAREISQALGYTVSWNRSTRTVYLNNKNEVSNAPNPSNERIVINGNPIASDVSPQIINGRTMVPIRIISEGTGARVKWDQQSRRVTVDTANTITFPNNLGLKFEATELEQVEQLQTIPSAWEKKGSLRLGEVNQAELVLELYETNLAGFPLIHGVFAYNNQQFVLNDLSAGTIDEVKNQNLELSFGSGENQRHVVSTLGAEYASQILVFNPSTQQWSVMHVPGKVVASGNDGIWVQFPGKGLNPPAVSLIRFQNDRFAIANFSEAFSSFANRQNVGMQQVRTHYQAMGGQSVINFSFVKNGRTEIQAYTLDGNKLKLR